MTTSFAQDTRPRTSVVDQLTALGVKVHPSVEYGPGHTFNPCDTCGAVDAHANCTVYGADDDYRECCSWCVVSVADDFSARLVGRFDQVVVEIGVAAAPTPTLVLDTRDRSSDLDDPRCEQHARTATFAIQTEQHERGLFCDRCIADALRHALLSGGFTPGAVSAVDLDAYLPLPVTTRGLVSAA